MRNADFSKLFQSDFNELSNILADGVFAAYLLGYDTSAARCAATINQANLAEFADGEEKPKKRPYRVRSVTYLPNGKDETGAEITDDEGITAGLRFDVPPQEAIDYFKRKKVVPSEEFYKLDREAKAGAFTISGDYETDVIEAFHNEITAALENGTPEREVVKRFKEILGGGSHKMLGDLRLENIFRTNMQLAYGTGRRRAQEDVSDLLPYWKYSAVGDDRTRPTHRALDGLIYPANHSFWDKYYPPWDFRCRCSTEALPDYPGGYKHERPNVDTTIRHYDEDGLPTRAEYDGYIYDIKTVKFTGVPRQASLETVLKGGANRALVSRKK